jgi:hypothetical protein
MPLTAEPRDLSRSAPGWPGNRSARRRTAAQVAATVVAVLLVVLAAWVIAGRGSAGDPPPVAPTATQPPVTSRPTPRPTPLKIVRPPKPKASPIR